MKFLAVVAVLAVAGCDVKSDDVLTCGAYDVRMVISDDGDTINANVNGDDVSLVRMVSASGARYVGVLNDVEITMWSKGADWTMFIDDGAPIFCK